ncbi:uncharacterized protein LOC130901812 [Diorhabda carinulata]|uniref:uncharacterized protein LOC130901812 n=1 Tax=Diorhabda carinulata TaxID=1163345 RepID=UPI0025A02A7F|nr:uncharacterized protein LOC130901812 [Diorhabda carinulata]
MYRKYVHLIKNCQLVGMEPLDDIFTLQLITLFDSLSFGLIYAFLPPYIFVLGGSHVTIGFLAVTTLIAQLLSSDIIRDLIHFQGRKTALYTIFNIAAICHALLFLTNSSWFTILARCIFAATNQSSSLTKAILMKKVPSDETQYQLIIFNILSSSGYIIGPILAGCLFDISFAISCFLASVLTIINICLLATVSHEDDDSPSEGSDLSVMNRTAQYIKDAVQHFNNSDYKTNWDLISMKYMFTASTTIFFSKFTQILKYNFQADSVAIGYTTSYMNALMFIGIYLCNKFKSKMSQVPIILIINGGFIVLLVCTFLACYSPVYSIYAALCIPIVLARTLILDYWEDLVNDRKNTDLKVLGNSISIGAGLTVPIAFGILCNQIGHHAVIIFSVLPLVGSLIILNRYMASNHYKIK